MTPALCHTWPSNERGVLLEVLQQQHVAVTGAEVTLLLCGWWLGGWLGYIRFSCVSWWSGRKFST